MEARRSEFCGSLVVECQKSAGILTIPSFVSRHFSANPIMLYRNSDDVCVEGGNMLYTEPAAKAVSRHNPVRGAVYRERTACLRRD